MISRPVVVVMATGDGSHCLGDPHEQVQRLGASSVLAATLSCVLASHLPLVVVASEALADLARRSVATRDIVVLPEQGATPHPTPASCAIAAGVGARPNAQGWLVLPGDMPLVQPSTLQAMASALNQHPVAYAQYRGRRGRLVGFSAELYSELVTLASDEDARRLAGRYPSYGVEVDDAGILVDLGSELSLDRLRRHALRPAAPR